MITKLTTYKLVSELLILEKKLDEGLIMTHDINSSKNVILNSLDFTDIIKLDIENNKMILFLTNEKQNITLDKFLTLLININNLGYYVARLKIYNSNGMSYNISISDFKSKYLSSEQLINFIKFDIYIEPKFDIKHQLKTNILYHVTEQRYLDKILSNGLITKSKNTLTEHPERLYLVYNIEDAEQFIMNKKRYYSMNFLKSKQPEKSKFQEINFVILKIKLPLNNDLIFYDDPNFKDKGIYTYDNINKNYITIYDNKN